MLKGLYTAYTGLRNEQNRMDIMTNNLANASTVGFKKEGSTSESFRTVLAYKLKDGSTHLAARQRIGRNRPGVKIGESYTDFDQGPFRITGNTYDLALSGSGFFAVEFQNREGENEIKYTRSGSFTLSVDGDLMTKDGDFVLDEQGQHIRLNTLLGAKIRNDGTITQNGQRVAKIGLKDFEDYNYLERYGETYYQTIEGAVEKPATAIMESGYLEMSNVSVVNEMVNMIAITRAYESNQKIVQTYDASLEITANQLGKL